MVPTAGLSFKPVHFEQAMACPAEGLWFEVHAENYMVAGGPRLAMLEALRERFPLSLHGVGLSLAGAEEPNREHLVRFRRLVDRYDPFLVSEHLAWSRLGETSFPDLSASANLTRSSAVEYPPPAGPPRITCMKMLLR